MFDPRLLYLRSPIIFEILPPSGNIIILMFCILVCITTVSSIFNDIQFNSIQFSLFSAHINISYNIDNVHIMCRKRGGQKKKKKKKKKKKLYLTPNVQYITYQMQNWILSNIHTYLHTYAHTCTDNLYIYIHHKYKNNIIIIYFGVGDFY